MAHHASWKDGSSSIDPKAAKDRSSPHTSPLGLRREVALHDRLYIFEAAFWSFGFLVLTKVSNVEFHMNRPRDTKKWRFEATKNILVHHILGIKEGNRNQIIAVNR